MENKYLVKLTPVGKYYFGSENSFNAEDKANGGFTTNYLVRSRKYPQQTTLLGMMRFAILQQFSLLDKSKKADWPSYIGKQSFNGLANDEEGKPISNWGLIDSISPLFLINDRVFYLPAGLNIQHYKKDDCPAPKVVELSAVNKEGTSADYSPSGFHWFKDYDPKQHAESLWKQHDKNVLLPPDEIFVESFQVGITKSREGKPDNYAFYKEFFYQLKPGFSFAFYLTTKEPLKNFDSPSIIQSGGDQSLFRLELEASTHNVFSPTAPVGKGKFVLLSDAYCDAKELLPLCDACITQSVDFRFMQTTTDTERYYNLSKRNSDMRKSAKLNLLERGSVLFVSDAKKVAELLHKEAYKPYQNAGFNFYSFEKTN